VAEPVNARATFLSGCSSQRRPRATSARRGLPASGGIPAAQERTRQLSWVSRAGRRRKSGGTHENRAHGCLLRAPPACRAQRRRCAATLCLAAGRSNACMVLAGQQQLPCTVPKAPPCTRVFNPPSRPPRPCRPSPPARPQPTCKQPCNNRQCIRVSRAVPSLCIPSPQAVQRFWCSGQSPPFSMIAGSVTVCRRVTRARMDLAVTLVLNISSSLAM
jgi:hypothetical protein